MKLLKILLLTLLSTNLIFAQESEIQKLASENISTFNPTNKNTFIGNGWEKLLEVSKKSNSILVGEEHFTNEIPYLINTLSSEIHFDNFICEIDPFSAKTIESKIENLNDKKLNDFLKNYGDNFSFFELKPEFELFQKFVKSKTNIIGLDQISLVADRLIISELKNQSKNEKAKSIYSSMEATSKKNSSDIYMFTDDFQNKLNELLALNLSAKETEQLMALKLSREIYLESKHHLRIQWMKNQLIKELPNWKGKKNLFKFGAVHMPSGESLLEIYDIGNFVNNIEDSEFRKSLHILIIGKSGYSGTPDKSNPTQIIDENSAYLKIYKPFFNIAKDETWHLFDLQPFKKAISENKLSVENVMLSRVIKGYDYLIVVPRITPAKFIEPK
ncbi:hypothetical protein [Myroides guanonis]|uniref:Erythromycin esterase n=1 Tax=Myroides guanonis TaxID=1150112 RepID=A0A1I3U2F0_9FLAO|nr:hypothetical protein [Myroides guanonis]SFJ76709.1 hypothetical protein SAMN04487893_11584 [Myroides guanonis]